jgi:endoglycosylceramidase
MALSSSSSSSVGPIAGLVHTAAESHHIFDAHKRVSVFHGTNIMVKGFPYYPDNLRNLSHIQDLKKAGFNAVRLGIFWAGAEPSEGQFNTTYYDIMGGIVDDLHANGIHAFIDLHQDVLSTRYCLYDAFPLWAIDKAEPPTNAFPWPLKWDGTNPCPWERGWSANYFAEATGKAFESLFNNYNGLRDDFVRFWTYTAEYFKDRPVLGYEIINEPWAGDIYAHPDLLLPGHAGSKNLAPFYEEVAAGIRSADPNHLIFYEPVTWGMIFNGTILGKFYMFQCSRIAVNDELLPLQALA